MMNGNKWLYSLIGFLFLLIMGSYSYTYMATQCTIQKYDLIISKLGVIEMSMQSNNIQIIYINKTLDMICETVIKDEK